MTTDQAIYKKFHQCGAKRYFKTYPEALEDRTRNGDRYYAYACTQCDGFHHTSSIPDAASKIRIIERIFGRPVTPELVTAFNELSSP